jgi:integrase
VFHDLRHFFATALIAGGASVKQVQAAGGWASAAIVLDTYAARWPSDEDTTRAAFDRAWRGVGTSEDSAGTGTDD